MQAKEYRNFIVRASHIDDAGEYKVEVLGATPDGLPEYGEHETRRYDPTRFRIAADSVDDLLDALERRPVNTEHLFAVGEILGDLILPGVVRKRFLRSLEVVRPNKRLRLRLILSDARLAALPWEFSYIQELARQGKDPQGFLSLRDDVSIVRHESIDQPEPTLPRGGKYRIVAAFASPQDQDELDLKADREAIANAVRNAKDVSITPEWVEGATRESLELALVNDCDIFHFSGHGYFQDSVGKILLEKAGGTRSDPYDADKLLQLLKAARVKVAILGACEGGRRSGANQWTGIAPILVKHDLAAVVASQYRLLDASAIPLAERLYGSLVQSEPIDDGVYQARRRIFQQDKGFENRDWGALVLYLRVEDGIVFPHSPEPPAATAGPRISPARLQIPLLGRAAELSEMEKEFGPGKKFYWHGAIGVGKTSLTTEIFTAALKGGKYPRYLWGRVTNNDVEKLLEWLATFFPDQRVSQAKGKEAKLKELQELMAAQPGLMIGLDDVPDEGVAKVILEAVGDSAVLLNGQRTLNLSGIAQAREVKPLSIDAAEELFLVLSGLEGTANEADKKTIQAICKKMRCLPLGVTLAAQRCSEGESPQTVLERLKSAPQDLPSEDAEVKVLFRASYKELESSPEAQRLLARLAWYETREAPLEALREGQPEVEFFQAKDKVVALGLVTAAGRDRLAEHPLLGGLAHSEAPASLVESEEKQVTQWLLSYARINSQDFHALDREQANLLGLLERKKQDRTCTIALVGYLFDYLRIRGQWKELLDRLSALLEGEQAGKEVDRAQSLFRRGIVYSLRGSYEDALQDFRDAESFLQTKNERMLLGRVAYWRSSVLASRGEIKEAAKELKSSLRLMGDAPERASAHSLLGSLLALQGNIKGGKDQLTRAVIMAEAKNDLEHLAHAYLARGTLSERAGDLGLAQEDYQRALDAATKIGDPLQQALVRLGLGYMHYHRGRFDDARALFEIALSAFQELGYPSGISKGLHALGNAQLAKNDPLAAEQYYRKALDLNKKYKQTGGAAYNQYQLGVAAQRRGDLNAENLYSAALNHAREVEDRALEAACFAQLTRFYLDQKNEKKALEYGRQSLELAHQVKDRLTAATALYNISLAQAQQGQIEEASKSLADSHEAFAIFGGLETAVLEDIRRELDELKRHRQTESKAGNHLPSKSIDRVLPERIDRVLPERALEKPTRIDRIMSDRMVRAPGGGSRGGFGGFGGGGTF